MSDTKKYLGYFSIILFIAVLFVVGILLGRDKKGFLDLPKTGEEITNQVEKIPYEKIEIPLEELDNSGPPIETNKINPDDKYIRKGSVPNSIYLYGDILEYVPNQFIKLSAESSDMKFLINVTCKIVKGTEFSNISFKRENGEIFKYKKLMSDVIVDQRKFTMLSIQYTTELLYDSSDNICITVEQYDE